MRIVFNEEFVGSIEFINDFARGGVGGKSCVGGIESSFKSCAHIGIHFFDERFFGNVGCFVNLEHTHAEERCAANFGSVVARGQHVEANIAIGLVESDAAVAHNVLIGAVRSAGIIDERINIVGRDVALANPCCVVSGVVAGINFKLHGILRSHVVVITRVDALDGLELNGRDCPVEVSSEIVILACEGLVCAPAGVEEGGRVVEIEQGVGGTFLRILAVGPILRA